VSKKRGGAAFIRRGRMILAGGGRQRQCRRSACSWTAQRAGPPWR
jgi:hypothetical protein